MAGPTSIEVGEAPVIHLTQVDGDLVLNGRPGTLLTIMAGHEETQVTQDSSPDHDLSVHVACHDDCVIQAPANATLHIGRIQGDARVNGISGTLHIQDIRGDLSLNNIGPTSLQTVAGDISAHRVQGDLTIVSIQGDASISGVQGACRLAGVSDDLSLSNVAGDVEANAGDDVSLRLVMRPGVMVNVQAGGDLVCRVPTDTSAQVALEAGQEVNVRRLSYTGSQESPHQFTLGAGEATLRLVAGGSLTLLGSDTPWETDGAFGADIAMEISMRANEFAQQIASQVESQVRSVTRVLDEKLSQFAADEELANRIQEKVQAAMSTAEAKISDAIRVAEEQAQAAEQRSRQRTKEKSKSWSWTWPTPPASAQAAKTPRPNLSDEERMTVLRMVEEGKISVEQAEQLLAALRAKGR